MASLVPEDVTRLQVTAFVNEAELSNIGRSEVIRTHAKRMSEVALHNILERCVKTEGDYMGYQGQTLRLDVYVLSPDELHRMLIEARQQGADDARRWSSF